MTAEPRRLLCLYPWMELGGADKFNLDMLAQLTARGWAATVVTTLPSGVGLRYLPSFIT